MAVDAVYLYDEKKQIRRVIVHDVYELIHDEATYELDAEIDAGYEAKPGEFLGFFGVEGFLLFEIDKAEIDDRRGVTVVTATDAAVAELAHLIVPEIRLTDADARTAALAALAGSDWTIGRATQSGRTADLAAYYETRWKALREIETQWQVRVTPRFAYDGRTITGKTVDVTDRESVYRGRLLEGATGTNQIYVTYSGAPVTRMYGIGKAIGEEDPPSCVTFADIEWSRANGDPADKPKGQTYIEDADAIARYGNGREAVHADKNIEDPLELLEATREALSKATAPKVSGTATAADMETVPGYEHMIARKYDRVWVRTRRGTDVTATIINVKRNHLRRGMTKIVVGEEPDEGGLTQKVARTSSAAKALESSKDSFSNRYVITRQLIQFNADTIQMNARLIEANAEIIRLTASNLKEYEEGTDERLTSAELILHGDGTSAQAGLVARVEENEAEVSRAALTLYGDGTSAQAGLVAKVGENEASIVLHADELGTLAEVKADKVDLGKYATVQQLEAERADIETEISRVVTTDVLNVLQNANFTSNSISIGGTSGKWLSSPNFVRSITLTADEFTRFVDGEGYTRAVPVSWTVKYNQDSINYFGYEE